MKTNKWQVDTSTFTEVIISRVEDNIPISKMVFHLGNDEGKWLSRDDAIDLAQQIVDDWNFSCDELEV